MVSTNPEGSKFSALKNPTNYTSWSEVWQYLHYGNNRQRQDWWSWSCNS